MKKQSNAKLAFFSLRVLPVLVAAAFIAFALASSHSVGETSSCAPSATAQWPSSDPNILLNTDFYWTSPFTAHPVLVFRECNATSLVPICQFWDPGAPYHAVVQDIRGSPDCANTPTPFIGDLLYKYDQDDGHRMLTGIEGSSWAQLPGGARMIAMEGWSNGGIVSYLAAVHADPSLGGIQPHFATGDLLNYGLFNGGVLHKEIPYPVDFASPSPTPSWKDYVGLGIWNKYLITDTDAASANVAGLHVGGWFDVFGQATLDSFSRLQTAVGPSRGRQKVVIGPWLHGGGATPGPVGQITFPNSTIDHANFSAYDTAWKQCVLQYPPDCTAWNNTNTLPAVKVYLMSPGPNPSGVWTTYSTWPPPGVQVPYYFTSGGGLSGLHQSSGQVPFPSNPNPGDPCPTLGGTNNLLSCITAGGTCGPYDQRTIEGRSDVVVFTSDAMTTTHAIVGRIHANVWIQTALLDVDVFVRMTDVYPDGHSMLMAQGIQRASYINGACHNLLSNAPTLVRVDLGSTALMVNVNHKLRVIVSASAGANHVGGDPIYSLNPQNGNEYIGQPPVFTQGPLTVLVGGDRVAGYHESALVVSVPAGSIPQPDERPNTTPCPN